MINKKNKQSNEVSLKFMKKEYMFSFQFVEKDFDYYYDEIFEFCERAEKETTLDKTKNNMKAEGWEKYPESLLYRLYYSRKYDDGNGALSILYDSPGNICSMAGVERHTNNIAIMAKRYYVRRKYRFMPLLSNFILGPQVEWATKKGFKVCLITVNEYQRHTVLQLFKRAQKRKAMILGDKVYPEGNIYEKMQIVPVKTFINGEYQFIIVHKIDDNYNLDYEELK